MRVRQGAINDFLVAHPAFVALFPLLAGCEVMRESLYLPVLDNVDGRLLLQLVLSRATAQDLHTFCFTTHAKSLSTAEAKQLLVTCQIVKRVGRQCPIIRIDDSGNGTRHIVFLENLSFFL